MRTAVLTISSAISRREAEDRSGPLLARLADAAGADVTSMEVVPDDLALIEDRLHHCIDEGARLILTTGGIGVAPHHVTPEATRRVIERELPGIAEALRAEVPREVPGGMLSRGVAGVAGETLIVNLPGSARDVEQLFALLAPVLEHAVAGISSRPGG